MGKNRRLYMTLVNRIPGIQTRYRKYREHVRGAGRIKAWGYLMKLNLQYYVLRQHDLKDPLFLNPDKEKKLYMDGSESSQSFRESPKKLAETLAETDIVSFDVFDTLILRSFGKPTDIFFMVSQILEYPGFERIRREMEQKAREKKYRTDGHREVTFEEIWEVIEEETGISSERGQKAEWDVEKRYCFANPYFLNVVQELKKYPVKMVITSDMYLSKEQIRELLIQSGYPEFDEYFISCEYGTGKCDGGLYTIVKHTYGADLKYAHIGDNTFSDYKKARKAGFTVFPYTNVNEAGNIYRSEDMSAVIGSMYRGTVNAHLHNGLDKYSVAYEFGFVYGGMFVLGYCQFIHEYVKTHSIDRILFLARDGDILHQVYQYLYPEEADICRYVYWSRLTATKMSARYFKYDYFRRFLYHKVNQNYTVEKIFESMEISDMLEEYLSEYSSIGEGSSILTMKEADALKHYLMEHWDQVLCHYDEQLEAGYDYYSEILKECRHAVAVDVGWAGSGAIALDYIVNNIWQIDCEITGLLGGTNSVYNDEPDSSEGQLQNGKLVSYLFSQSNNRDIWKQHDPGKGHNIIIELLLSSDQASFRKFGKNGRGLEFSVKTEEIDSKQVQRGIRDFVQIYKKHFPDEMMISGRDCMAPILLLYQNKNWLRQVFDEKKVKINLE